MTSTLIETPVLPREKEGDSPATNDTRQPPENPQLSVLHYEPWRYIVVDKPADVRIDGDFHHTVAKLALSYIENTGFNLSTATTEKFGPRFVHRLDYATSGVILIALSKIAAGVAATQFEQRQVKKEYLALVHGNIPVGKTLVFDQPIADGLPEGSYHMMVGNKENPGRNALTECVSLGVGIYNNVTVSKVLLKPTTGRRHQLRVHCANAGFPIVGDATYIESDEKYFGAGFFPPRMMLHAHRLVVKLPPKDEILHGRKSGIRKATVNAFVAEDPFVSDKLKRFVLEQGKDLTEGKFRD